MAIGKPRGKNGARPVFVYDKRIGRKVYVGSRTKLNGPGGAKELEAEKIAEFAKLAREGQSVPDPQEIETWRQYSERWFEVKHGDGTKRPARETYKINESRLKPFLKKFGDRAINGGIGRREALDWSLKYPHGAKAACAMVNDAIDDEICTVVNPLANRGQKQAQGRKRINPITEGEVARLCEIALERWKDYGPVCSAWISFLAWVGCRPGEAANVEWPDLDFDAGEVEIRRIKPPYDTDVVVLPDRAAEAIQAMGPRRNDKLVFVTAWGKKLDKDRFRYYWDPVRSILLATMDPERKAQLLGDRPDFDLYELRHMCASVMADRGANEYEIAEQLGNSPEVCRETYIHAYKERVRERNRLVLNADVASLEERRKRKSA